MTLGLNERVISEFLRALGPWSEVVAVSGGYAPIIYRLYLCHEQPIFPPVGTSDIDSLIARRVAQVSSKSLANHLEEAGFGRLFKDLEEPATESYARVIDETAVEVEFLTDLSTRGDRNKNVRVAGVVAQPLSYLSISLRSTREFHTRSGQTGYVVSPGAWIFHKCLTFNKRLIPSKVAKDLYGIWYVASQLGSFSEDALLELEALGSQRPRWLRLARTNLSDWIDHAVPADWSLLEAQDPNGRLARLNFIRVARRILQ